MVFSSRPTRPFHSVPSPSPHRTSPRPLLNLGQHLHFRGHGHQVLPVFCEGESMGDRPDAFPVSPLVPQGLARPLLDDALLVSYFIISTVGTYVEVE